MPGFHYNCLMLVESWILNSSLLIPDSWVTPECRRGDSIGNYVIFRCDDTTLCSEHTCTLSLMTDAERRDQARPGETRRGSRGMSEKIATNGSSVEMRSEERNNHFNRCQLPPGIINIAEYSFQCIIYYWDCDPAASNLMKLDWIIIQKLSPRLPLGTQWSNQIMMKLVYKMICVDI